MVALQTQHAVPSAGERYVHVRVRLITLDWYGAGQHSTTVFPGDYQPQPVTGEGPIADVVNVASANARRVGADEVTALRLRVETRWDGVNEHALDVRASITRGP